MWRNTLIFRPFIYKIVHSLSQYNVHNNKYQVKYSEFAKHSEARKQLKDNVYAERSKAEKFL